MPSILEHRGIGNAGENVEFAAERGVADDNPARAALFSGFFVRTEHHIDIGLMPALTLAEIVRVKMICVIRVHVEFFDPAITRHSDIIRNLVVGIHTYEIYFGKAEVGCELHACINNSPAGIGLLVGFEREVETVGEAGPRAMVEEGRVLVWLQDVSKVCWKQLRPRCELMDILCSVFCDQVVFNDIECRRPAKIDCLQEEAVGCERDLVFQFFQIGS